MSKLTKAFGSRSLWLGVTSVAAGAASAAMHGNLIIIPLSLCLLFGVCAQFAISFLHRYTDERYHFGENETDGINFESTPFSTLSVLREAMWGAALVTLMIGLTIIAMGGWVMVVLGIILLLLAVVINAGKHPLCRTPWGVGLTSLAYGPVGTLAVCFLQSQRESAQDFNWYDLGPAIYIGFAVGFLMGNWQIIYNYSQYEVDKHFKKNTLSVKIGLARSRAMIIFNSLCCTGILVLMGLREYRPDWIWVSLVPALALPFYIWISVALKKADEQRFGRLLNLSGLVMFLVMVGLFIVFCFTGVPIDTHLTLLSS